MTASSMAKYREEPVQQSDDADKERRIAACGGAGVSRTMLTLRRFTNYNQPASAGRPIDVTRRAAADIVLGLDGKARACLRCCARK